MKTRNNLSICVVHSGFDTHVSRQFRDKCLQIVVNSGIFEDTVPNSRIFVPKFVLKFVLKLSWFWNIKLMIIQDMEFSRHVS